MLGRLFEGLALVFVFACAVLAASVLHSNLEPARKVIATGLTYAVDSQLQGRIEFIGLENIGPGGFGTREVNIYDANGDRVIASQGTRIRFDIPKLLLAVITGPGINVEVAHVRIESAQVELELDEDGELTLANAFLPKVIREDDGEGPDFYLSIPRIELGRATARIRLHGLPPATGRVREAHASVDVTPERTVVDVPQFGATIAGLAPRVSRGTGSVRVRAPGPTDVGFSGFVGDVSVDTSVHVENNYLSVNLDIPRALPEDMLEVLPGWPVQVPVQARVHGEGLLPKIDLMAEIQAEDLPVYTRGTLNLAAPLSLDLEVYSSKADLRSFLPGAPALQVPVSGHLKLRVKETGVLGTATANTGEAQLGILDIPGMNWALSLDANGAWGTAKTRGNTPLKIDWRATSEGVFTVDAKAPPMSLSTLFRGLPFTGVIAPHVQLRIADGSLTSEVDGVVQGFEMGVFGLDRARVQGTLGGPLGELSAWVLDADVEAQLANLGPAEFSSATFRVKGNVGRSEVRADLRSSGTEVSASALLNARSGVQLDDVELVVKSAEAKVRAAVQSLQFVDGGVAVKQVELTGAGGELVGDVDIERHRVAVELHGKDVNLDILGRALDLPTGTITGQLNLDAKLATTEDEPVVGKVQLGLGMASFGSQLRDVSARLRAEFGEKKLTGSASVYAPKTGSLGAIWDLTLADRADLLRAWREAIGSVQVQLNSLALERLAELVPWVEWPKMEGVLHAQLDGQRASPDQFPSLYAFVRTDGLDVQEEDPASGARRSVLGGADVQASIGVNGGSGETVLAAVLTSVGDEPLMSTSGTVVLDLKQVMRDPGALAEHLLVAPIQVNVQIPQRAMNDLPYQIAGIGVLGEIAGRASLKGTLSTPDIAAELTLRQFKLRSSRLAFPVDGKIRLTYQQATSALSMKGILETSGAQIADIDVAGQVPWNELVRSEPNQSSTWSMRANAKLQGFPLRVIPFFASKKISAQVDGALTFIQDGSPQASANFEFADVRVAGLPLGQGAFSLRSSGPKLEARLTGETKGGKLDTRLLASFEWDEFPPRPTPGVPIRAQLQAADYDSAILLPVLADVFSDLEGPFDADLNVVMEPPKNLSGRWGGGISGTANLKDVTAQFAGLGLELSQLNVRAVATRKSGGTVIQLSDLTATSGDDGELAGSGRIELNGMSFEEAGGDVQLAEMPIYVEGVNRGSATGHGAYKITRTGQLMLVAVQIPKMDFELSRQSPRQVLPLSSNPNIRVLQSLVESDVDGSGSPTTWRLAFHLGSNVALQRRDLNILLSGEPVIDLGETTTMTGYISLLQGGRFPVLGKNFIIQSGTVSFDTGDISDPRLTVSASWRAPDATIIFVDVSGKLSQLQMKLRSDPPMSQQEIYARLVGGLTTSSQNQYVAGGEQERAPSGTAAIGPSAELLGLNDLLGGTPLRRVELLIDTTSEGGQTYTVAYQLTETVWIAASYLRTYDPSGSGVTTLSEPAYNFVSGSVDWRFLPDYTMRVEFGSAGGAIDWLWQHFY